MKKFKYITIPSSVFKEAIEDGITAGYSDAIILKNFFEEKKIEKVNISQHEFVLKNYLHPGEYEAILLAQEKNGLLVMDEKKGRFVAERKNIDVITTVDLLLLLCKEKAIDYFLFQSNLGKYASAGWLSPEIYQKYLLEGKKFE
ncbi:MAG TPA: hypothetical protein VGB37_03300 [Candidatus Lokiarchaeia archaeon]